VRLDRRLLGWGVFFILLGAVPLAVRQGLIPADAVARAWTLWPLLLIAAGVGLLLRRTPFEFLGGLLTAATLGLIGGALIAGGAIPFGSCSSDRDTTAFPSQHGDLSGRATVSLNLNCGDLTVRTADGSTWTLEGVDEGGQVPTLDVASDRLRVSSPNRSGINILGAPDRWTVTLPTAPTLDLQARVNAGSGRLDLRSARLAGVDIVVNAGALTLDLSQAVAIEQLTVQLNAVGDSQVMLPNLSMHGAIRANAAGDVRLCPPAGAGLRLTTNDNLTASNNYAARGLSKVGAAWETPSFASAAVRIDLETTANAGSFELGQEGSCGG
jgi:cell wall-active antibiotic response 4TMS protein YvqF